MSVLLSQFLVRKPRGIRPLGRSGLRGKDNIKIYVEYMWCREGGGAMNWIDVAKFRAVLNIAVNRRVL